MSLNIHPLADYLVAQQEEASSKTASGLFLPENAQEKPKVAKVLACGQNAKQVKVGDRIIYKGYSTTDIKFGSEEYILVKEEDVLATVK
ncbi:MAG TPA: co-chaperone GroES [Candidatus Saccharimonadia bacterium]|nr:co-chaperone GroES [Candidatus Saccharimonadia bacterium]